MANLLGKPPVAGSGVIAATKGSGWNNPNLPPDVKDRYQKVQNKMNGLINVGGRPGGPGPPAPPPTLDGPPLIGPPPTANGGPPLIGPPPTADPYRNEVMRILWGGGVPQLFGGGSQGYTPGYTPGYSFPSFTNLLAGLGGR